MEARRPRPVLAPPVLRGGGEISFDRTKMAATPQPERASPRWRRSALCGERK